MPFRVLRWCIQERKGSMNTRILPGMALPGTFVLVFGMLVMCGCHKGPHNIISSIYQITLSPIEKERHTALLLLGDLELSDELLEKITEKFETSDIGLDRLLLAYVLYHRTQETVYENAFVEAYPFGRKQADIWELGGEGTYLVRTSPLVELLAYLAHGNVRALDKLVSGWPFADGMEAEMLQGYIEELKLADPARVEEAFHRSGVTYR